MRHSARPASPTTPLPVADFLRRRSRRFRWRALAAVVAVLVLIAADRLGLGLVPSGDLRSYDGHTFTVDRVVDGDTLILRAVDPAAGRDTTRVRLWAIDAPELARPEENRPAEPFAEAARDRLRELAEGRRVTLRLESHRPRDNYGRLLAFVELTDEAGDDRVGVLNERLTLEGLARADGRWPHRHLERYATLERTAKKQKRGVWGDRE